VVHLDYRDARPIYAQIVAHYRRQITEGILRAGERMPSVRELAAELAINPNTIQRAYRELEMEGWIASVSGKGSFVCGVPAEAEQNDRDLLRTFDQIAAQLLQQGVTREALIRCLQEGGNKHA